MVRIADDVPVVMLVQALRHEGFELASTTDGLVLRLSSTYLVDGMCTGKFVPSFLRHLPGDQLPPPDGALFLPTDSANATEC